MNLARHDVSQEIGLAFMRHQELIAVAQQQRLLAQAGQSTGRNAPTWRRRLGQQLVTWGEALQASSQSYSRSTAHD